MKDKHDNAIKDKEFKDEVANKDAKHKADVEKLAADEERKRLV